MRNGFEELKADFVIVLVGLRQLGFLDFGLRFLSFLGVGDGKEIKESSMDVAKGKLKGSEVIEDTMLVVIAISDGSGREFWVLTSILHTHSHTRDDSLKHFMHIYTT